MDFDTALTNWLALAQQQINKHFASNWPNNQVPQLFADPNGRKFIRIVSVDAASRSAYAFVNRENGDILKPDGWKKPAKHARGNIYRDNAMEWVTPHGIMSIR